MPDARPFWTKMDTVMDLNVISNGSFGSYECEFPSGIVLVFLQKFFKLDEINRMSFSIFKFTSQRMI